MQSDDNITNYIKLHPSDLAKVRDLYVTLHKKSAAIKHVMTCGIMYKNGVNEGKPGLREAKDAIELMLDKPTPHRKTTAQFFTIPRIKGVIIDTGHGDVELDLDGLQLKLLNDMSSIPISAIGPALKLLQYFREWEGGDDVG